MLANNAQNDKLRMTNENTNSRGRATYPFLNDKNHLTSSYSNISRLNHAKNKL